MKAVSVVLGVVLNVLAAQIVAGLAIAGLVDTTTPSGRSAAGTPQLITLVGSLLLFGLLLARARSARRVWSRTFVWLGVWALALPLSTLLFSGGYISRATGTQGAAATAGAAVGGTLVVGFAAFVGFFLGALFLVLAWAVSRGAGPEEPTRRCPKCAEHVLAAALVCKHCGHVFAVVAPAPAR